METKHAVLKLLEDNIVSAGEELHPVRIHGEFVNIERALTARDFGVLKAIERASFISYLYPLMALVSSMYEKPKVEDLHDATCVASSGSLMPIVNE